MDYRDKTKKQLSLEITKLRQRLDLLEITEADRREKEVKLREAVNKYRTIFENAADAIYLIDPETQKILDCNAKASEITGYTCKELKTLNVADLHPVEEQDVVSSIFSKITQKGALTGITGINQFSKRGTNIPVEINASVVDIGDRKYISTIIRDITGRKQAENNLRAERNKFVGIFDVLEDGVYITNQHHDIEYVNSIIRKQYGAVKGHKCHEYLYKSTDPCPQCKFPEVSEGKTVRWEWHSPETRRTYAVVDSPLKNADGSISKLQISRDITGQKESEDAMRRLSAMEERLRTAAIRDDLTGLFNRRGFFMLAERQMKLADRTKKGIYLVCLDIAGFKSINEEHGHNTGDQALCDTTDILRKTFRDSDIIGRLGGDEFSAFLAEPSGPDMETVIISHIKDRLKDHNESAGRIYKLSFSVGIVHYDPSHPCPFGDLLSRADELMFEDKKRHKLRLSSPHVRKKARTERRAHERFACGNNSRAQLDKTADARIRDISLSGICLEVPKPFTKNSVYQIKITSLGNDEITPTGIVVWSSSGVSQTDKDQKAGKTECGLRFIGTNESLLSSLENFIHNQQR